MDHIVRAGYVAGLAIHRERSRRALPAQPGPRPNRRISACSTRSTADRGFWLHDAEDKLVLLNKTVEHRFANLELRIELGRTGREIIVEQVKNGLFADFQTVDDPAGWRT